MSEVQKIDFAKYRTPELAEQVSAILNPAAYVWLAFKWAVIWFVILCLCTVGVFWGNQHLSVWFAVLVTAGVTGWISGLFFGAAAAVNSGIDRILRLITLMLNLVQQITNDCWDLSKGKQELPERKELIRAVFSQVLMPTIEQVIADRFWFLGKPILWGYRLSLGRIVDAYIKQRTDETSEETLQKIDQARDVALAAADQVSEQKGTIDQSLDSGKEASTIGSQVIRTGCGLPLYCLFAVSLLIGLFSLWMIHTSEKAVFSDDNVPGNVQSPEDNPVKPEIEKQSK